VAFNVQGNSIYWSTWNLTWNSTPSVSLCANMTLIGGRGWVQKPQNFKTVKIMVSWRYFQFQPAGATSTPIKMKFSMEGHAKFGLDQQSWGTCSVSAQNCSISAMGDSIYQWRWNLTWKNISQIYGGVLSINGWMDIVILPVLQRLNDAYSLYMILFRTQGTLT